MFRKNITLSCLFIEKWGELRFWAWSFGENGRGLGVVWAWFVCGLGVVWTWLEHNYPKSLSRDNSPFHHFPFSHTIQATSVRLNYGMQLIWTSKILLFSDSPCICQEVWLSDEKGENADSKVSVYIINNNCKLNLFPVGLSCRLVTMPEGCPVIKYNADTVAKIARQLISSCYAKFFRSCAKPVKTISFKRNE